MFKIIFLICIVSFFLPRNIFALDENSCETQDFSCYTKQIDLYCKNESMPWNKSKSGFGKVTLDYVPFESTIQNNQISKIIETETNRDEKTELMQDLDISRIGKITGFRAVEIARIQYRTNMNRIFACAVISGRQEKISKILTILPQKKSDITDKFKKEAKRYEKLMGNMNCGLNNSQEWTYKTIDRIASSATIEYCNYIYYLDYLGANVESDFTKALEIESKIWDQSEWKKTKTTEEAAQVMRSRQSAIEKELIQAQDTLPKALVAYREMERTYAVHIILVMIFDDYIRLRDNLSNYLNAVSQLFEKAYNAQDKNAK